jgi:hypothetical protein
MVRTGLKKFALISSLPLGITLTRTLKFEIKPAPPRRHHGRFQAYQHRIADFQPINIGCCMMSEFDI